MSETMKTVLVVLGAIAALAGMAIVYGAGWIVDRQGLAAKKVIDPRILENLPEEQVERYRRDAAIVDVKIKGTLISIPGMILVVLGIR